jgi:hypothetical protein
MDDSHPESRQNSNDFDHGTTYQPEYPHKKWVFRENHRDLGAVSPGLIVSHRGSIRGAVRIRPCANHHLLLQVGESYPE